MHGLMIKKMKFNNVTKKSLSRLNSSSGFSLIEVMVVIVILGILATMIVPRIMGRPDEARRTKAMLDIKSISQALELYRLDNYQYPTTEQGLHALVVKPTIEPIPPKWKSDGYLSKVPMDPWGNHFVYLSPGLYGSFDIISFGADGEQGGEEKNADIQSWKMDEGN